MHRFYHAHANLIFTFESGKVSGVTSTLHKLDIQIVFECNKNLNNYYTPRDIL